VSPSDRTELLRLASLTADLLDGVPNVMFCVKDHDGCYQRVNQAFADRCGRRRASDVVGRTARELFPKLLAADYEAQDRSVLATQRPMQNQLERITRLDGSVGWYVSSKVAIVGDAGPIGVASLSVDLRSAVSAEGEFAGMAAAFELIRTASSGPLRVDAVAAVAHLSVAQLERRMKRLFGVTAKQVIVRTRVDNAARLLVTTTLNVAEVASAAGFYDHSQMARTFRSTLGVSPTEYRDSGRVQGR
jgi:PAS domain S-box-containing protein